MCKWEYAFPIRYIVENNKITAIKIIDYCWDILNF